MTPDLCLPACFFMTMLPRNGSCVGSPYCCVDHSVIDIRLPVSFLNDLESQTGFEPMLRGSFCGALMPIFSGHCYATSIDSLRCSFQVRSSYLFQVGGQPVSSKFWLD